jgi:hypothetical protein
LKAVLRDEAGEWIPDEGGNHRQSMDHQVN